MINLTHLTKRFGATAALDDVTFSVAPGTIVGFLGPNGAGKSTCLRSLVGLVRPDSGEATVNGMAYATLAAVSYTHLDVYKRQGGRRPPRIVHPGRRG